MSTPSLPPLPQRVRGAVFDGGAADLQAEYAAAAGLAAASLALVTGEAACFECEHHPGRFTLTTTSVGELGGVLTRTWPALCVHCAASVAHRLPADVDVILTRIPRGPHE